MFQQIAEIVLIQPPHLEAAGNLAFQQLFHLLIAQYLIIRHGCEITHQGTVHIPQETGKQVCRLPPDIPAVLLVQQQLETDIEPVVHLIFPDHGDKRFGLPVYAAQRRFPQVAGSIRLGTLLRRTDAGFRADLQGVYFAVPVLGDKLPKRIMYRFFLLHTQERIIIGDKLIVREAFPVMVPDKIVFDIFNRILHE